MSDLIPYLFGGDGEVVRAGRGVPFVAPYVFPPPGALWYSGNEVATNLIGNEWGGEGDESGSGDGGGGIFGSGGTRSFVNTTEQSKSGAQSMKVTIDTGTQETGLRCFRWSEPQNNRELYFSAWYFIPVLVTPTNYWNIMQIKSKRAAPNDNVNDPTFTLNIGNRPGSGAMRFYLYRHGSYLGGSNQSYNQDVADIPVGKWFNVEWHLIQSTGSNSDGSVTIWQDGVQLFNVTGARTKHTDGDQQWSTTNYSDGLSPAQVTIYQDDLCIATSRVWAS